MDKANGKTKTRAAESIFFCKRIPGNESTAREQMSLRDRRFLFAQNQPGTFIPKPTISNYENDRIDIKSSVIAELAEALQTDPNYLILGEKTPEADNRFVNEAAELFLKITDPKVQKMLLKQIRALV